MDLQEPKSLAELKSKLYGLSEDKEYVLFIDEAFRDDMVNLVLSKPVHVSVVFTQDGEIMELEEAIAMLNNKRDNKEKE